MKTFSVLIRSVEIHTIFFVREYYDNLNDVTCYPTRRLSPYFLKIRSMKHIISEVIIEDPNL